MKYKVVWVSCKYLKQFNAFCSENSRLQYAPHLFIHKSLWYQNGLACLNTNNEANGLSQVHIEMGRI